MVHRRSRFDRMFPEDIHYMDTMHFPMDILVLRSILPHQQQKKKRSVLMVVHCQIHTHSNIDWALSSGSGEIDKRGLVRWKSLCCGLLYTMYKDCYFCKYMHILHLIESITTLFVTGYMLFMSSHYLVSIFASKSV